MPPLWPDKPLAAQADCDDNADLAGLCRSFLTQRREDAEAAKGGRKWVGLRDQPLYAVEFDNRVSIVESSLRLRVFAPLRWKGKH
jgi:hypothetical protein